jgi:NADH-quinone oxidoreductase subunit L
MEAPVPASALIHSATLVSAGVFLLLRFSCLFENTIFIVQLIIFVSSLTAAFGGVGACFQSDIKRILAYSTISHCGFLILLACLSTLEVVLFYLCVHGFFKALVFMCVGNVIRFARNYQDFRYMGGFYKYLPFESIIMFIGLLNLGGLPFSLGFFIKHYTLLSIFDHASMFIKINILLGMITSLVYSYRLYYYVFFDVKKAKKAIYFQPSKNNLKSKFYSNSTLASNIAILFLLIITLFVVFFLYVNFFNTFKIVNNFPTQSFNNKLIFSQASAVNSTLDLNALVN